jgi:hypothetical protein
MREGRVSIYRYSGTGADLQIPVFVMDYSVDAGGRDHYMRNEIAIKLHAA